MATLEKSPSEVDKCDFFLQGTAKNLADRLYGPQGPPAGTSLTHLEAIADRLTRSLRKRFLDLVLARQSAAFHDALPADLRLCSSCGRDTVACDPEPRLVHSRAGVIEWLEPQRYCGRCRKAFFPQSKSLGIDLGHYSPSLLNLICYAGANKPSFREASLDLDKIGNVSVHEKQVERLSKRIGAERLAERDAEVVRFLALPLAQRCDSVPDGVPAPAQEQVAVIMADAGMLQLRDADTSAVSVAAEHGSAPPPDPADELVDTLPLANDDGHDQDQDDPDQEQAPAGRHWHEDKVGLVLTMRSSVCQSDPCPDVPKTFVDADRVGKIVRGLKKAAPLKEDDEAATADAEPSQEPARDEAVEYEGPQLQRRRVVASRRSWPSFGPLLAMAAWRAGFAQASRKAFVADGARAIWRLWRARFSSYVPILDFIHALSYVYTAAKAVGEDAVAGWVLYAEWIQQVWQGQVSAVIATLETWQQQHGVPDQAATETSPRQVVNKALNYLRNNHTKMKYDEYRKQGLPIVSSLVESMVKQIGRRVKGTEKFWGEAGAEAILQLRADYLSDGDVLGQFWQRRQAAATGQRSYRTTT
jgi:hypothetical protein